MRQRLVFVAAVLCVGIMACLGEWLVYELDGFRTLAASETRRIFVGENQQSYRCQQTAITQCPDIFDECPGQPIGQCTTGDVTCYRCSNPAGQYRACVPYPYDQNCVPDADEQDTPCGFRSQSECTWVIHQGCFCVATLGNNGEEWEPFDANNPCDTHCEDDQ